MRYYFAPMEGITDSIYRQVHHKYFGGVDRYYMPFLSPTMHRCLTHREERELPMADSVDFVAIPQVLTKVAEDFLWAAQVCADRGYDEVNLNLGCPSGTVVAKSKGSGMLRDCATLERFLDEIYAKTPIKVSIKTRLGMEDPAEFANILSIYNQYPVSELTIHPRVRKQFYSGSVDMDAFTYATENTRIPLCYNGDLTNKEDIAKFSVDFPQIEAVMIGRGLIGDPGMLAGSNENLAAFVTELLETYIIAFGGSRNAMFRMKENWNHITEHFQCDEKLRKRLRKTTDLDEYRLITAEILQTIPKE